MNKLRLYYDLATMLFIVLFVVVACQSLPVQVANVQADVNPTQVAYEDELAEIVAAINVLAKYITPVVQLTATDTPLPTATNTLQPTQTSLPTATNTVQPTATSQPTATNTAQPTATSPPTATSTPTESVGIASFYVSTSGDNLNLGTQDKPFRTIQRCLDKIQPGDTCEVFGGTYNEKLTLKTSGTQLDRITLKTHANDTVTVNSGNSQTLVTGGMVHNYTVDGFRFISSRVPLSQAEASIDLGMSALWISQSSQDGGNNGFILKNCYVEGAVRFFGHNNLVENCELNGKGVWMSGIAERFGASHDNIYRNNTIHDYDTSNDCKSAGTCGIRGIWSMKYTDNTLVEGNHIYDVAQMGVDCDGASRPVTRCTVINNTIHDILPSWGGAGIQMENAFDSIVDGNKIYNVLDGIGVINYGQQSGCYRSEGDYYDRDINTIFSNNIIYNTLKAGIRVFAAPGGKIYNNTIYNTVTNYTYLGGIAFLDYCSHYSHNWEIMGNTISQNNQSALWFKVGASGFTDFVIDYNRYDFSSTDAKFKWELLASPTQYYNYTLSQMQNLLQLELHSILE